MHDSPKHSTPVAFPGIPKSHVRFSIGVDLCARSMGVACCLVSRLNSVEFSYMGRVATIPENAEETPTG